MNNKGGTMENISYYEIHTYKDPNFPVIFHFNTLEKNNIEILPHWHTNIELLYISFGSATVITDNESFTVKAGEIVVINSNSIHSIKSNTENTAYYCLIIDHNFSESLKFNTTTSLFKNRNNDVEMKNIFQIIINEVIDSKPYYKVAVKALCHTMLVLLFRNQLIETPSNDNLLSPQVSLVKKAMEYIHHQFNEEISLESIAQEIGISKFYFSRIFKNITGKTVNTYINQIRCNHAQILLTSTDMGVYECAEMSGFNSTSYFTKCFKEQFGYPPSYSIQNRSNKKNEKELIALYERQKKINESGLSVYKHDEH